MMESFSPYATSIVFLFFGSLAAFYVLGLLFYKGTSSVSNLAIRLGIGFQVFLTIISVAHAGLGSMMILFIPVLVLLFLHRINPEHSETRASSSLRTYLSPVASLFLLGIVVLMFEASRFDLREGTEFLYVGNTDVSFYSAHGQMLYRFGEEALASSMSPETQSVVYHFSDLWVSGFYSHYFDVVPYYSYGVLYRTFGILIVLLLFYSLSRLFALKALALGSSLLVLLSNNASLSYWPTFGTDLLQPFAYNWPMYAESSYLIVGVCFLTWLLLLFRESTRYLGVVGLMSLGIMHASFVVPSVIAAAMFVFFKTISPARWKGYLWDYDWTRTLIAAAIGIAPYIYIQLDGRGFPLAVTELDRLIYLTAHTFSRVVLTISLTFPILIGLAVLVWKTSTRKVAFLSLIYALSGIIGFCILYAIFQSTNTIKPFTAINSIAVIPLGILGLLVAFNEGNPRLKVVAGACLVVLFSSTIWSTVISHGYELVYSWQSTRGYKIGHTLKRAEVDSAYLNLKGSTIAFAVCNDEGFKGGMIRYNEFIDLSGLIPRSFVFRLNRIDKDSGGTLEGRVWADKSAPAQYERSYDSPDAALHEYLKWLNPDFIIEDQGFYCGVDDLDLIADHRFYYQGKSFQRVVK